MTRHRIAALLAVALAAPLAPASADSECALGSPTPGFKVIRLDLPQGSSYLGIELTDAGRTPRPVEDGSSWHFARGIFVLDDEFDLVAYRIVQAGSSPKKIVASEGDVHVAQDAPSVDGAFVHSASRLVPKLAPGTYYAVGFGVDGDPRNPNEYWAANVRVQGAQSCASVASGSTFDLSHADAQGGRQVSSPLAGTADDAMITYSTPRAISVGLLDCSVQAAAAAGQAECEAALAGRDPQAVEDEIVAVTFEAGTSEIGFSHRGVAPVVSFAGASFDLD